MPFYKGITRKPDGKIGVNKTNPVTEFDVNGGLKIGNTTTEVEGVIRWNDTEKYYEYYTGTEWLKMGGGGEEFNEWLESVNSTPIPPEPPSNYAEPGLVYSQPLVDLQTYVSALNSSENVHSSALVETTQVIEFYLED